MTRRRGPAALFVAALALVLGVGAAPAETEAPAVPATATTATATDAPVALPAVQASPATPAPAADAARLWTFVDADGVAHFATWQVDSRYSRLLDDGPGRRVYGKTEGPRQLLTWLQFAPAVLAVQPYVKEAAARSGVDPELLDAVIAVESRFDPRAVSRQGAIGLMQITPVTADRYATPAERRQPAARRLLDPRTNILTGARMLADLVRRYRTIDLALAAWNAGEGTVRRAGDRVPDIPETEAHVHMVLELYWALLQRSLGAGARSLELQAANEAN